jgi:hypothetical protein
VAQALDEFLPQTDRQLIRAYGDGVLVVPVQQPGGDVRQLVFHREDIPLLPEECQALTCEWLADQERRDTRREVEKN